MTHDSFILSTRRKFWSQESMSSSVGRAEGNDRMRLACFAHDPRLLGVSCGFQMEYCTVYFSLGVVDGSFPPLLFFRSRFSYCSKQSTTRKPNPSLALLLYIFRTLLERQIGAIDVQTKTSQSRQTVRPIVSLQSIFSASVVVEVPMIDLEFGRSALDVPRT